MASTEGQQGRTIGGRYVLRVEIGRGGMGVVWRATDQVLGRDVALKRVGTGHGDSARDLRRAEREARLAASLNHAHAVAVFDLVQDGDEQWLVMEYVESRTLARLVREEGALDPDAAAPLLRQAAEALASAHHAGIVHRDVKPSNMLVTPTRRVKLTDFGIARGHADVTLTQTGMMTGSPAYLAPEVASGEAASAASDVWAFGATLYHALTGRPPYQVTDNVMATLYKVVHDDPPRPDNAGWLLPLLEATMAKDPRERWSMAEVVDYLAGGGDQTSTRSTAVLADPGAEQTTTTPTFPAPGPTLAPSQPEPQPAPTPTSQSRSRRGRAMLVGAVALLLVGLLGWALVSQLGGDDAGDQAAAPEESSSPSEEPDEEPSAEEMTAFVEDYLATVTEDPRSTWPRLTPSFQRASGGFGSYRSFWGTIESANPRDIQADPDSMQVSYTVDYVTTNGSRSTDQVQLTLVEQDGELLIDGES